MLKREHCMETMISKAQSFYSIAHFLAMAKLKQAWLCSSGLTKTFFFKDNRDNRDNFLYVVFRAQPWHT